MQILWNLKRAARLAFCQSSRIDCPESGRPRMARPGPPATSGSDSCPPDHREHERREKLTLLTAFNVNGLAPSPLPATTTAAVSHGAGNAQPPRARTMASMRHHLVGGQRCWCQSRRRRRPCAGGDGPGAVPLVPELHLRAGPRRGPPAGRRRPAPGSGGGPVRRAWRSGRTWPGVGEHHRAGVPALGHHPSPGADCPLQLQQGRADLGVGRDPRGPLGDVRRADLRR